MDFFTNRLPLKRDGRMQLSPSLKEYYFQYYVYEARKAMTFIEPKQLVRGWKRIRLSPYKPKTQLTIREKYLAMKCGLLGKYARPEKAWGGSPRSYCMGRIPARRGVYDAEQQ
jgi:hypothetical protein